MNELPWIRGITRVGMPGTGSARQAEVAAARDCGARIFTAADIHANGIGQVLAHLDGKGPSISPSTRTDLIRR